MQLITAYLEAGLPYAYRGHADCAWDLRPSLLRIAPSAEATHLLELGKALVTEFKSQAHLALDSRELPQLGEPAAAWWALMQHHGAPTRTLDWTQSAMVAAYFAVERLPDRDGALFLVDIQSINEGLNDFFAREGSGLSESAESAEQIPARRIRARYVESVAARALGNRGRQSPLGTVTAEALWGALRHRAPWGAFSRRAPCAVA